MKSSYSGYNNDLDALREQGVDEIEKVLAYYGIAPNPKFSTANQMRVGSNRGSLCIEVNGPKAGFWFDHGGAYTCFGSVRSGGDIIQLIGALDQNLSKYGHGIRKLDEILNGPRSQSPGCRRRAPREYAPSNKKNEVKAKVIENISRKSQPVFGTVAEAYLRARGLNLEHSGVCKMLASSSKSLRFVPDARNYYDDKTKFHVGPALVLLGRDPVDGTVTNLQQVFLTADGSGKAQNIDSAGQTVESKKSLGTFENPAILAGSVERNSKHIALVEGPENGMTLRSVCDLDVYILFGLANAFKVEIPDDITHITLVSDGDLPESHAGKKFRRLATHLRCQGYYVREVNTCGTSKMDLNDVACQSGLDAVSNLVESAPFLTPYPAMSVEEGTQQLQLMTEDVKADEIARANIYATVRNLDAVTELRELLKIIEARSEEKEKRDLLSYKVLSLISILCRCLDKNGTIPDQSYDMFKSQVLGREAEDDPRGILEIRALIGADKTVGDAFCSAECAVRMLDRCRIASRRARDREIERRIDLSQLARDPAVSLWLVTPGTGKTTSILQSIHCASPDAVIWVLMPRTDKAAEFYGDLTRENAINRINRSVFQIRGRSAPSPDAKGTMCARAEIAEQVAASGRSVFSSLCKKTVQDKNDNFVELLCPFYEDCAYIKQREIIKAHRGGGVFVATHAALTMPIDAPAPDLVFIDEDPALGMKRDSSVPLDRMRLVQGDPIHVALQQAADDHDCTEVTSEMVSSVQQTLKLVREALETASPLSSLVEMVGGARMREIENIFRSVENRGLDGITPISSRHDILARLSSTVRVELRQLSHCLSAIARELIWAEMRRADGVPVRTTFNGLAIDHAAERRHGDHRERYSAVNSFRIARNRINKKTPVVVMDATADPVLLERALRRPVNTVRVDVRRKGEVVQVIGRSFSNQSLTGKNAHGSELTNKFSADSRNLRLGIVDMLRREGKKAENGIFVCASKSVRESFVSDLAPDKNVPEDALPGQEWDNLGISWAHFGATRGMNIWEVRETAVIIGRKQIPPSAAMDGARAFYWDDDEPLDMVGQKPQYVKQKRKLFKKDGSYHDVEIDAAQDPRVHRILWQHREAEIIQSMDRVRGTRHERRILLLNCLDLRMVDDPHDHPGLGLPVDQIVSWIAASKAETRFESILKNLGGFIPLSPSLLQKHSGEFMSVDAAKKWIQRSDLQKVQNPNTESLWKMYPLKTFLMRPQGRKGGKAVTLVVDTSQFQSLDCAKKAISNTLGLEFSYFEPAETGDIHWAKALENADESEHRIADAAYLPSIDNVILRVLWNPSFA